MIKQHYHNSIDTNIKKRKKRNPKARPKVKNYTDAGSV
jgi:hypothetical protein